MITLTFRDITNQNFHQGLSKLVIHEGFTPKIAYLIGKIADKIEQEGKKARGFYGEKIAPKFGKKDEKGNFIPSPKDPGFELIDEAMRPEYNKDHEEFLAIKFVVERDKLKFEWLEQVKTLTPKDYLHLEPLYEMGSEEGTVRNLKSVG